jgi:intracellular septation protein
VSTQTKPEAPSTGGRLLIDLGPLLVFFGVNFATGDTIMATGAFMAAIVVAILVSKIRYRHISPMLWFSGVMVLVLGGITIWLHDETFIKVKPTIYYVLIASLLSFGLATGRNYLKLVLGSAYPGLSERGWKILTRNWALFFLVMAFVNEAVWRSTTTDFWIGFKIWGFMPATFLFALAHIPMLMRHGMQLEPNKDEPPIPPVQ